MQAAYIARRFGVFLLILWLAATLNFFLPRLSGQDPVHAKLLQQAALGGYVQAGIEEMTREYEHRFGLDQPLWRQYLTYLRDVSRLDFNYSIANYPKTVRELVIDAVPWTLGLLGTTTLLSFVIRQLLRAPRLAASAALDVVADAAAVGIARDPVLSARPDPDLPLGLPDPLLPILRRLLARLAPSLQLAFHLGCVFRHALLPALVDHPGGDRRLGARMRGMMVTTMGEDYVVFAEARPEEHRPCFCTIACATILPQVTVGAGACQILSAPCWSKSSSGIPASAPFPLFQAIRENDHFVIQGVVFIVIGARPHHLRARRVYPGSTAHFVSPDVMRRRFGVEKFGSYLRRNPSLTLRWPSSPRSACS